MNTPDAHPRRYGRGLALAIYVIAVEIAAAVVITNAWSIFA